MIRAVIVQCRRDTGDTPTALAEFEVPCRSTRRSKARGLRRKDRRHARDIEGLLQQMKPEHHVSRQKHGFRHDQGDCITANVQNGPDVGFHADR